VTVLMLVMVVMVVMVLLGRLSVLVLLRLLPVIATLAAVVLVCYHAVHDGFAAVTASRIIRSSPAVCEHVAITWNVFRSAVCQTVTGQW
jgi:amino acid permease